MPCRLFLRNIMRMLTCLLFNLLGAVDASIIPSLQNDPACLSEITVFACKINGTALTWRWNQSTIIRTYNMEHRACQQIEPPENDVTGADIRTALAVVERDSNNSIIGCLSILEITPTNSLSGNITCIASDKVAGDNTFATVSYRALGKSKPKKIYINSS